MVEKRGEAGIGTLILLIALVLVAAIAASVLLQTSGSLQSKALATGSTAQTQVSTQVAVMQVWAENGSSGTLNYIYANIRLDASSDPIHFNNTLVDFDLTDSSVSGIYYGTVAQCNESLIDNMTATKASSFAVQYLTPSQGHVDDYLQQGEVAQICFTPPQPLTEKESFRFSVLPKSGQLVQIKGTTPDTFTDSRIILFPN